MIAGSPIRTKLFLIASIALALALVWHFVPVDDFFRAALDRMAALGIWGQVIFVALYVIACVCFVPGSLLTLGAGAAFGLARGYVCVTLGSVAGAVVSFLIGRHIARDWVSRKIAGIPRFKAIDEAVAVEGWKIVFLTRLSPVFPFNLLNYAFGLTRVSLRDYFLASWIGMVPGTLLYVYIGSLARSLARVETKGRPRTPAEWALSVVGLAATLGVTIFITRIARRALEKKIAE